MRNGNRRLITNTSHFDADTAMNMDTFTGSASIFNDITHKLLEGVEKMSTTLKKWVTGKDQQRNKLPRKPPIGPKPRISLSSLTR